MSTINGPAGPGGLGDINNSQRLSRSPSTRPSSLGGSKPLSRSGDEASISSEGVIHSKLSGPSEVRTELLNRITAQINDPDYDLDGKFEEAFGLMLNATFES